MPIYDYVCHHCGHRFEVIHGINADGPKTCPVCGSSEVRKGFVTPTFVFKGSGWAKKDRSTSSKPPESKPAASGDSKTTGDGGSDAKGDSKGDAKGGSGSGDGSSRKESSASDTPASPKAAEPGSGSKGGAAASSGDRS